MRDQAAYKAHEQALAAAQKNDFNGALSLIDKAIQQQPKEGLFFATKGQLKMAQKDDAGALQAFQQAAKVNPEYYLGFLGTGLMQKKSRSGSCSQRVAAIEHETAGDASRSVSFGRIGAVLRRPQRRAFIF
ncbi:MAG: hypothetical protein NVV73_01880 [Cellvibrionaceae bacterium]|nr:hypothetical protein [Cellvibrionaceae bacterium]